jgi:hypothetical protein
VPTTQFAEGGGQSTEGAWDPGQGAERARWAHVGWQVSQDDRAGQERSGRESDPPEVDQVPGHDYPMGGGVGMRLNCCFGTTHTTVETILSAKVCFWLSHNGNSQPT